MQSLICIADSLRVHSHISGVMVRIVSHFSFKVHGELGCTQVLLHRKMKMSKGARSPECATVVLSATWLYSVSKAVAVVAWAVAPSWSNLSLSLPTSILSFLLKSHFWIFSSFICNCLDWQSLRHQFHFLKKKCSTRVKPPLRVHPSKCVHLQNFVIVFLILRFCPRFHLLKKYLRNADHVHMFLHLFCLFSKDNWRKLFHEPQKLRSRYFDSLPQVSLWNENCEENLVVTLWYKIKGQGLLAKLGP